LMPSGRRAAIDSPSLIYRRRWQATQIRLHGWLTATDARTLPVLRGCRQPGS